MANVKLIFNGSENSGTYDHEIQLFHNTNNQIYISIEIPNNYPSYICLDKSTSIKLHRELKKQISFISESEVNNG
jgi:hypothetical protein